MTEMLAYCGLNCNECPAFIARRTDDDELRENTAKKWNGPSFPVSKEDINCDGCKTADGVYFRFCSMCSVRTCASNRGVETCAHCADYGCNTLQEWLSQAGEESKQKLENLRAAL